MSDEHDENNGLLDDDPALDFILYQEMEGEKNTPKNAGGCLGLMFLFILPFAFFVHY